MTAAPAPTSQKAGVRPISFVLDNAGVLSAPVTLNIRPQDLTRDEPTRASVNQTLGRGTSGWVDFFGEGLPSCNIAGHTGWRYSSGSGMDGVQAFDALNSMVAHDFHDAKQTAIDRGIDPEAVKLLFIDMLDDFAWSVVPMRFVLRRSKSQPLLMTYQITLQAVSTQIDNPVVVLPFQGNTSSGLRSLAVAQSALKPIDSIEGFVSSALSFVDQILAPIAGVVRQFVGLVNNVLNAVTSVIRGVKNLASGIANRLIGIAGSLASVGLNLFRAISSIANLPNDLRASIGSVARAFNEVVCIFKNSLRTRKTYEQYEGLYGASNCSSTTGGRDYSPYANLNVFELLRPQQNVPTLSSSALLGVAALTKMDPVLAPLSFPEIGRHVGNIVEGVSL